MSKYTILIILNAPLAIYGLFNVFLSYKLKRLRPAQAFIRIVFWSLTLATIILVEPISSYLYQKHLTDSPAFSIFDVFLATGIMISLILVARAYARIAEFENRQTQIHEKLSIELSKKSR
jgi:hypothetical protein